MIDSCFIKQISLSQIAATASELIRLWLTDLVDDRDQLKLRNDRQVETIAEFQKQVRQLQVENQLSEKAINSMGVDCLNQSKLIDDNKRTIKNVNERAERQKQELIRLLDLNTELKARLEDINRRSAPSNSEPPKPMRNETVIDDDCNCPVCVETRRLQAEASKRAEANERGDVFGDCPCPDCVAARSVASVARAKAYLAERRAANEARVKQYGSRPSNRSYNPYGAK